MHEYSRRGIISYLGEFFAFTTAIIWAFAVVLFKKSGESVHPITLNAFKNTFSFILFLPTFLLFGQTLFYPAPWSDYLLLLVSGFLGIGLADTLFFFCLNLLGAGMSAIVDCLYSPFIIALSILWLGDQLSLFQIIGTCLIISAIIAATGTSGRGKIKPRDLVIGILLGASAMASMAVGIVMIKPLLNRSPLLWVTEIRLIGGLLPLFFILLIHPQKRMLVNSLFIAKQWKYTISGSFLGAYLATILWLAGMKFTQTSIAAALNQTSNIFIFIFAAAFLKERINRQRIISIILAVIGAILVTFS